MRRRDDDEDDEDTSMRPSIERAPGAPATDATGELCGGGWRRKRGMGAGARPVESLTVSATRESKTLAEFDELARDREFEALNYLCAT